MYDCSERKNISSPPLNNCLETGPPLRPPLFNMLLHNRVRTFCIMGDKKQVFLQIQVHEQDWDAQLVLCYDNLRDWNITENRFTREMFGDTFPQQRIPRTGSKHDEQLDVLSYLCVFECFVLTFLCTVPIKGHGICYFIWTGNSPLWTGNSPLWTSNRYFKLVIVSLNWQFATLPFKDRRLVTRWSHPKDKCWYRSHFYKLQEQRSDKG